MRNQLAFMEKNVYKYGNGLKAHWMCVCVYVCAKIPSALILWLCAGVTKSGIAVFHSNTQFVRSKSNGNTA